MRSALPLDEISEKFDVLFRDCSTDLVLKIWKSHMKAAASRTPLVIEDIKTKIWYPTFEECKHLLDSVRDRSIKLTEVDYYFRQFERREMILQRLNNGMRKCLGAAGHSKKLDWIKTAVHFMEEYWSLLNLADAAKTVMSLKSKRKLSGDFILIETIAKKVTILLHDWEGNSEHGS